MGSVRLHYQVTGAISIERSYYDHSILLSFSQPIHKPDNENQAVEEYLDIVSRFFLKPHSLTHATKCE